MNAFLGQRLGYGEAKALAGPAHQRGLILKIEIHRTEVVRVLSPKASLVGLAALRGNVTGGDFGFVGGEGCQNFGLLSLWNLEEVQGPSKLRCDLVEFF